jgi:hypothetical protein
VIHIWNGHVDIWRHDIFGNVAWECDILGQIFGDFQKKESHQRFFLPWKINNATIKLSFDCQKGTSLSIVG